jgi:Transposase protein
MKVLADLFTNANPILRLCTLAFDEMGVSPLLGYYGKTDQIIGPHKKMSLTTLTGIIGQWKLPIHFNFDFHFDFESLTDLIKLVHEAGMTVIGTFLF